MLFFRVWIIVIVSAVVGLSWWRKERKKSEDLSILATCQSGTVRSCWPWKHLIMPDMAHGGRLTQSVICALVMWLPFFGGVIPTYVVLPYAMHDNLLEHAGTHLYVLYTTWPWLSEYCSRHYFCCLFYTTVSYLKLPGAGVGITCYEFDYNLTKCHISSSGEPLATVTQPFNFNPFVAQELLITAPTLLWKGLLSLEQSLLKGDVH